MTTKVEEQDGKFVVTFNGELDTAAAAETEEALAPVMESLGTSSAAGSPEKSTGCRFPCGPEKRERCG